MSAQIELSGRPGTWVEEARKAQVSGHFELRLRTVGPIGVYFTEYIRRSYRRSM